jgi:hypothetical protein
MSRKIGIVVACICVIGGVVFAILSGPSVRVGPSPVSFVVDDGLNPSPQILGIWSGEETMNWVAENDAAWLTLDPTGGSTDGETWITLSADILGMHPGEYSTTVSISCPDAGRTRKAVPVSLIIMETQETLAIRRAVGGDADDVEVYYGEQPFYSRGVAGTQVNLVNNNSSTDVTWQELLQFLESDYTQSGTYIEGVYMCGSFAEDLHNNAEQEGIRSAWVAVHFEDGGESHALNAFFTVDYGLVFVDCTGGTSRPEAVAPDSPPDVEAPSTQGGYDKVAYLAIGREYGLISADVARSPAYWFYEEYRRKADEYAARVDDYNRRVEEYSQETSGEVYYEGSDEYNRIRAMYDDLMREQQELDWLQQELGAWLWSPLGAVSRIEIYW